MAVVLEGDISENGLNIGLGAQVGLESKGSGFDRFSELEAIN
jgi:hypothetical protein